MTGRRPVVTLEPFEDKIDWISGKGFSYGYLGGGLQFAIALGLVAGHEHLGISQSLAARLGIAMAGFWWAGFTLFTVKYLREVPRSAALKPITMVVILFPSA